MNDYIMPGYHYYRVLCNRVLIASFQTKQQADDFVSERKAKWPANEYVVVG